MSQSRHFSWTRNSRHQHHPVPTASHHFNKRFVVANLKVFAANWMMRCGPCHWKHHQGDTVTIKIFVSSRSFQSLFAENTLLAVEQAAVRQATRTLQPKINRRIKFYNFCFTQDTMVMGASLFHVITDTVMSFGMRSDDEYQSVILGNLLVRRFLVKDKFIACEI